MKLKQRIQLKEQQAELARVALSENIDEFRYVLKAKLASRTALAIGFGGGLLIGWRRSRRTRLQKQLKQAQSMEKQRKPATASQRQGLPNHWVRSYFIWPFLLASARDFVVSRRPTGRREA